jgi:hypothetical protein
MLFASFVQAPEILCGVPSSEKSDVYAYAVLLWELFMRKGRPFSEIPTFDAFCDAVIDRYPRPFSFVLQFVCPLLLQ